MPATRNINPLLHSEVLIAKLTRAFNYISGFKFSETRGKLNKFIIDLVPNGLQLQFQFVPSVGSQHKHCIQLKAKK